MVDQLRAPFPYFGGKSRAAALVWERFGKPVNYVEPFFGSGAVLLACPPEQQPQVETVNDLNCFVANFWRAVAWAPEAVARWADWPVLETDLHSRHRWLLKAAALLRARLDADPTYYDPRIAGWWVWGASAWIGSGWCEEGQTPSEQLPDIGARSEGTGSARGVHSGKTRCPSRRLPDLAGGTQWGTSDANARAGRGVHSQGARGPGRQLPDLCGNSANGTKVNGRGVHGVAARTRLYDIFDALSHRLRHVRVACGDWQRITTDAVTHRHGLTAVFLDPPYDGYEGVYGGAVGAAPLSAQVRTWAEEMGQRPDMRIALCGYQGEHDSLQAAGWEVVAWKAKGGFANQGANAGQNARRERIWFSPACLRPGVTVGQRSLFEGL